LIPATRGHRDLASRERDRALIWIERRGNVASMSDEPARHTIWTSGLWAFFAAIAMLGWVAWSNRAEDTAPGRAPYGRIVGANPAEAAQLARLLGEAHSVLRSPDFRRNLLSLEYPAVYARDAEQAASVERIAAIVSLEPAGSRFAPAQVNLVEDNGGELAAAGEGGVSGRYSEMLISRSVLAAYGMGDLVARSCAINVAAHEYAHTIVLTPMGFGNAFTDTKAGQRAIPNRQDAATPVASYLIGAVAQCTWLERQGRVGQADVRACVQAFGVRAFNWDRCGQFAAGGPVAEKAGLAPPAPPL